MKKFLLTLFALTLLLSLPAVGQAAKKSVSFDMAKYTCADFMAEKSDETFLVLVWIDGYLSGKTGDTRMDMKFMNELATEVGKACANGGKRKVLDIVNDLVQ